MAQILELSEKKIQNSYICVPQVKVMRNDQKDGSSQKRKKLKKNPMEILEPKYKVPEVKTKKQKTSLVYLEAE